MAGQSTRLSLEGNMKKKVFFKKAVALTKIQL
jgi:hypothetical protein